MKAQHFFNRHVEFALICLDKHESGKPFHPSLHQYFKANKQFGSRDRKTIKNLCYNWFRVGYSFNGMSKRDQVVLGHLCLTDNIPEWMLMLFESFVLPPSWLDWQIDDRFAFLEKHLDWTVQSIFPQLSEISTSIDLKSFLLHLCAQPLVWFRCTNHNEFDMVTNKLDGLVITENKALGINAGHLLTSAGVTKQIEIQDYSSQTVYKSIDLNGVQSVWDCCCASGGKSLTLLDQNKTINVCGSDSRKSILTNFVKRTGRHRYRVWSAIVDLRKPVSKIKFASKQNAIEVSHEGFDMVLADLPCTGSGTWNRNPEFKSSGPPDLKKFTELQRQIVQNAWPFVKKGGRLLYTTCSVYKAENEDNVAMILTNEMEVLRQGYVNGYTHNSDSMFFAELKKI